MALYSKSVLDIIYYLTLEQYLRGCREITMLDGHRGPRPVMSRVT